MASKMLPSWLRILKQILSVAYITMVANSLVVNFQRILMLNGIKDVAIMAKNPQANAVCERMTNFYVHCYMLIIFHRTLKRPPISLTLRLQQPLMRLVHPCIGP
jgi:hypothetical protein